MAHQLAEWCPAVALARAPRAWFAQARDATPDGAHGVVIRTMVLTAILLGTGVSIAATGRVTLGLVLGNALLWSWIPLAQLLAAEVLLAGTPRQTGTRRHLRRMLFTAHLPWSIWILLLPLWSLVATGPETSRRLLVASMAVTGAWNAYLLVAFCAIGLGMTTPRALGRVAVHQALIAGGAVALVIAVSGGMPRLAGMLR